MFLECGQQQTIRNTSAGMCSGKRKRVAHVAYGTYVAHGAYRAVGAYGAYGALPSIL